MAGKSKLKVKYASRDEAAVQSSRWTPAQLQCRVKRHAWELTSGHRNTQWDVTTQHFVCKRGCGAEQVVESQTSSGRVLTSKNTYTDPQYLTEKGTGKIAGDAMDELRRIGTSGLKAAKKEPSATARKKVDL